MSKIIGIDLGTTNSVVAVMEGGSPVVITTAEGSRLCPSVVGFNKNGERLVGQTAKRQAIINPENTIYSIKRFMGRRYDEVEKESKMVSYKVIKGAAGDARVKIPLNGREHTPQEISAMILTKLKTDAEAYLGEKVNQAVITVPAYFNDSQRQATKDAGQIAGLKVLRIINEPTASALAYGLDKKSSEKILVFDLGGGTFDVSVLEVGDGVFEVKATSGDTLLGGDDWDQCIVKWVCDEFLKQQGIDLQKDKQALQRLREAAEKAKIELSSTMETEINLPYISASTDGPKHLQMLLSRSHFEQLAVDLIERLKGPFQTALHDAGLTPKDIDEVVLVGGSSRMPMVQNLVHNLIGKEPCKGVNPDEVVAIGAAIQAGVLGGEVKDVLLLDVTPLSLGLETLGSMMTPLIERNTTIPVRKSQIFSTAEDGQTAVDVHVLQGERPMASDNMSLGRFRLEGIPVAPRGMPQIEVTFDIDANGILDVSARDQASGNEQRVTITASTNLTKNDIDRMVEEAKHNQSEDQQHKELVEIRNNADNVIYQCEKMLRDQGSAISTQMQSEMEIKIRELRQALQGENIGTIRQMSDALNSLLAKLMKQQTTPSYSHYDDNGRNSGNGGNGYKSDTGEGEVIEGEFQES